MQENFNTQDYKADGVELQLANKIYIGQAFPIKPSYLDVIRRNYFADAEQVNFGQAQTTANKVNSWVKKATRNRIKEIISPSQLIISKCFCDTTNSCCNIS